jgi:uncharacterized membrane protein YbhN (UPF0104 family)
VLLLKVAITGLLLFVIARRVDLTAVAASLQSASMSLLCLAFVTFLLSIVIGGMRWWITLRSLGQTARLMPVIGLFWIGMLFNQVLPAIAGDGLRVWLTIRRGFDPRSALNSVFLERVSMLLVLLALVVGTEPLLARRIGLLQGQWLPALGLVGGVVGVAVLMTADQFTARLEHWRVISLLSRLSADTRRIARSPWGVPLLLLTVVAHLVFVLAGTLVGMALGLGLSFYDNLLFIPLIIAATVLPVSVSGWGVREGLLILILGRLGISSQDALAMALLLGVFNVLSSLPGLLPWLLNADRRATSDR